MNRTDTQATSHARRRPLQAAFAILATAVTAVTFSACATMSGSTWKAPDLATELASPTRAQADRDRDGDRKPSESVVFFGVEKGMTVLDVWAAGGYFTEVLSVAVGPKGKVYSQNPPVLLKVRDGANDKAITQRLADNRLANVVRVDGDLPAAAIPAGSVDIAVTALNFHDVYNRDGAAGLAFMKSVYTELKPGGVFAVIDHVGVDGADNAKLHRIPKHIAIDTAKQAGFTVEAESQLLAHPADDHTKGVFDPALRGKTDQFILKLRKPK
jgi:predicted methyltransferase